MIDEHGQHLLNKFTNAWNKSIHAADSDEAFEAKCDYRDIAIELALWMMASPAPAETITDLDPDQSIWGNSPDESEVPNNAAGQLTVRDILDQIHTAARDHRQDVPGARDAHYILGYIERKEAEAQRLKIIGKNGYARTLQHIRAVRISTSDPSKRLHAIERIISQVLTLSSQAVQS